MGAKIQDVSSKEDRMKKALLTVTIALRCASSPHETMRQINQAINAPGDGSRLIATPISIGYTNYSYKVFVDKHPELCVYAKFCFEHAHTSDGKDDDVYYDLRRTENEYEIMKQISSKTPDCVVSPIVCWDVKHQGQKMKLLVTEWPKEDEQFSYQFVYGTVDPRIAPKVAYTLATLHCIEDFDPDFNDTAKPHMKHLLEHMKNIARMASKTKDAKVRTEAYCAEMGEKTVMRVMDNCINNYFNKRDCLIHGDAQVFNMFVESFGPKGAFSLGDWESATAGPIGMDVGLALSFPIGCMIAHALNGHDDDGSIEGYINTLIDTYLSMLEEIGKTPKEVTAIFRDIVGWLGWHHYLGFYILNSQNAFPMEDDVARNRLRDALGVLGLKLLRLSFDAKYLPARAGMKKLRKEFDSFRTQEVTHARDVFDSGRQKATPRKSSVLRISNRRLSDVSMLMAAESLQKLSVSARYSKKMERMSIAEDVEAKTESLANMEDDMRRIDALWGDESHE